MKILGTILGIPFLAAVVALDVRDSRKRKKLLVPGSGYTREDLVRLGLAGGQEARAA